MAILSPISLILAAPPTAGQWYRLYRSVAVKFGFHPDYLKLVAMVETKERPFDINHNGQTLRVGTWQEAAAYFAYCAWIAPKTVVVKFFRELVHTLPVE